MDGGYVARPLSVGEIFDRALTVYVKNWRSFTLVAVIMSLPATWITYVTAVAKGQNISAAGPTKTAPTLDQLLTMMFGTANQHDLVLLWISIGVSILVTVIVYPAFLRGLRGVYESREISFSELLAPGLHHFGRLLGVLGLWLLLLLSAGIASVIVFAAVGFVAGLLGTLGVGIAIALGLCVAVAMVVVAIGVGTAFDWSLFIATDEDKTAVAAIQEGLGRAMRRGRFWRTVGVTLALAVLNLVVGFALNAAISSLFLWTKSALLYTVLDYVISLPFYAFSGLVIATYFLDSRLRDAATTPRPAS